MKNIHQWIKEYNEDQDRNFYDLIKKVQDDAYLSALKDTLFKMGILSDMSAFTQGYKNLQERIKKLENETENSSN